MRAVCKQYFGVVVVEHDVKVTDVEEVGFAVPEEGEAESVRNLIMGEKLATQWLSGTCLQV